MRNLKRALSLALASVMLLGMMVVGTSAASYADVDAADNLEAIEVMQAAGIMIGDNGNFNPDKNVTRNEMAVVMANMLGLNAADYAGIELPFTDVPDWAKAYVAACYTNGIVSGTGATTYGGNDTVTAAQAGLMMMKALGYFQFQPDFGDDWMLATVKQASDIELYDGIEAGAKAPLTRNDVAQLALNALESNVMDYSGSLGTDIKTADGTTIKVGYTVKYDVYKTTAYDYNGDGNARMQLVEKLFKNKLTKAPATDDFQRIAHEWKYETKSIGKYADDAKLTYTKQVNGKTLYSDLGLTATYVGANVWLNGAANAPATINIVKNDEATKLGGNGTKLEVYVTKNASTGVITAIDLVMIQTQYGKISSVGKDADGDRIVRVDGKTYETEGFAKDDLVLYTWVGSTVKSMTKVEKATGKLTKTVGTDLYIDGVKYPVNAKFETGTAYSVGDTIDYIVDEYGYVSWAGQAEASVSLDNLGYFIEGGNDRGTYWAALRLADGTKVILDTDKDYSYHAAPAPANPNDMSNKIVMFEKDGDEYKLTDKTNTAYGADAYATDDAVKTDTQNIPLNNATTFVYDITTPSGHDYKVYTGYANAPTYSTGTTVSYEKDGVAVLVYVFVNSANITEALDDLTLVVFDSDVKLTSEKDVTSYYEYTSVADGKISTVKVDTTAWSSVSANGYGILTDNIDFDSKGVAGTVSAASNSHYADQVKVSGGVITVTGGDADSVYAYADDVQAYVVSDEQAVSVVEVTDIQKDDNTTDNNPYAYVMYHLNSKGKIDVIAVFEA